MWPRGAIIEMRVLPTMLPFSVAMNFQPLKTSRDRRSQGACLSCAKTGCTDEGQHQFFSTSHVVAIKNQKSIKSQLSRKEEEKISRTRKEIQTLRSFGVHNFHLS